MIFAPFSHGPTIRAFMDNSHLNLNAYVPRTVDLSQRPKYMVSLLVSRPYTAVSVLVSRLDIKVCVKLELLERS